MTEEEKKNVAKKVVEGTANEKCEKCKKSSVDFDSLTLDQLEEIKLEMDKVYIEKKAEEEKRRKEALEAERNKMYSEVEDLYKASIKAEAEFIKARDEYVKKYGCIKLGTSSNNEIRHFFDMFWG